MEKRFYELLIAMQPGATAADADALIARLQAIVQGAGGVIRMVERPGVRKLAFRVRGRGEAAFLLLTCEMPMVAVRELEQVLRLHEGVIRYMTTRIAASLMAPPPAAEAQPAPAAA